MLLNIIFQIFYPIVRYFHKSAGYSDDALNRKLGNFTAPKFEDNKVIMFHGVSVGEINAIEKLVKTARKEFPQIKIVVTSGTNTGQEIANKKLLEFSDFITYFPFDVPMCVERFLNKIKPTAVYMAETEIWPTFGKLCKKKGIKLYIINGRISDRTFKSYKNLKLIFKPLLRNYAGIFTQSSEDLNKFIQVGANPETTERMNNLKFDITAPNVNFELEKGGRILLAASTHSGEDELLIDAYSKLKQKHKDLKLIIAPRHLTRINEVEHFVGQSGFSYAFRSKDADLNIDDIMILDTMGELGKMFKFADISFIGGSFNKTGGHNPLESVIFGKPVISGPSISNFKDIYAIIQNAKAGFIVKDEYEFLKYADELLSNTDFYKTVSKACEDVFKSQQGALDFVINNIKTNI